MASRFRRFAQAPISEKREMLRRQRRKVEWALLNKTGRRYALANGKETFLVRLDDEEIGWKIYFLGEYDFDNLLMARDLLGRDQFGTVVDIGANIGSICIPAVSRSIARRSIAIEPEPVTSLSSVPMLP